jgi:hypothetical protein
VFLLHLNSFEGFSLLLCVDVVQLHSSQLYDCDTQKPFLCPQTFQLFPAFCFYEQSCLFVLCLPVYVSFSWSVLEHRVCLSQHFKMILLCVCSSRVWIQGLALARQVLYLLGHAPSPFCFSYFSGSLMSFCPGLA